MRNPIVGDVVIFLPGEREALGLDRESDGKEYVVIEEGPAEKATGGLTHAVTLAGGITTVSHRVRIVKSMSHAEFAAYVEANGVIMVDQHGPNVKPGDLVEAYNPDGLKPEFRTPWLVVEGFEPIPGDTIKIGVKTPDGSHRGMLAYKHLRRHQKDVVAAS